MEKVKEKKQLKPLNPMMVLVVIMLVVAVASYFVPAGAYPNCLGRFGYGDNTVNITNWFPIACVYDDRGWNLKGYESVGDPFYSDTSNFYVNILIPRKYKVGCTGKVINEKHDNEKIFYEIQASNVRDFAFILSDKFDIQKDSYKEVLISTYNLNSDLSEYATEVAKDSIKIFSNLFGHYPYDTYSVVSSNDRPKLIQ